MKKQKSPKTPTKIDTDEIQEIVGEIIEIDGEDHPAVKARLQDLNKAQLVEVAFAVTKTTFHSGPLPPASELNGYEKACPGAAERIVSMAEKEQSFRHIEIGKSEKRTFIDRVIGFFLGAFILITLISASMSALYFDKDTAAYVFLGTAALGVVGRFIPRSKD